MLKLFFGHPGILVYCFTVLFFTGLGQTFIVSQFIPHIQEEFGMSRAYVGALYSVATFCASLLLGYVGGLFDRVSTLKFALITTLLLLSGTVVLGLSWGSVTVFIGFYLVRTCGQITLGMVSSTTISRFFGKHRGKALAIVGFGKSMGEGILPVLSVFLISLVGWRFGFISLGIVMIVVLIPLSLYFVPKFPKFPIFQESSKVGAPVREVIFTGWATLLMERRALLVMVANGILPFVMTGLFFQQATILEWKGWSQELIASAFLLYSAVNVIGAIVWGRLVDHFSAKRMIPFILFPLLLALLVLYSTDGKWFCFLYMGLLGLAMGLYILVKNSFWAEVYGTKSLGRLKGMDSVFIVIGSSLSPVVMGAILDLGVSTSNLILLLMGVLLCGISLYTFSFTLFLGNRG